MIVIDEIGMSPENHSKNVSEEISECQNDDDDDDDDLEALRAKVLTSIPTKVIDCPKMPNKPKDNLKNVNNKLVRENCTSNKTLPYNKHNNKSDHFPLNRTELGEKSRYRLSRVTNSEPVRSVVKGKSLKIVLPSDVPNISKPNIVSMPEVSPPQVPRLVINVGQDSDTDEDLHNESDEWSRRVMIRNLENKHFGEEETNNLDVEKSVEMFLSNVRRQHESTLQNDKFVHFDESIDTNKNQLSKHCNEPIKEHVIATEFNVTGVFPLTKTPIKRISTSDETPVRLLPLSKQEEYKKLKQELENMEKQRKQIHKSTGLVTSKLKPSSSPLRYTLLNETHKKANETQFKQNQLGERILPLQRTNTPLVETNVNSKQNVSSAEASVELGSGAINVRLKDTLKRPEIQRVEAAEQKAVGDLEKAEKELLSERYSVIDELTEMNNLLGDFERAQEKLHNNQSEVIKLRKELLAAELKLENQKHVVSTIQKDFFATHTKMISGTLSCKQWEKTCSKLGLQINGTRYEVPNGGKNLLVKKLQQVAERSKELKIKERSSAQRSFLNSKSSNLSSENQGISEFKSGNCTRSESQGASEPSSQQTSEEVETCKVSDSHKGSKSEDFESVRSSITNPSEKSDNLILTRNVSKEVLDVSDVNNASSFNNNTVVGISDRTKTNLPQQFTAFREVAIKDNCAVAVPTSKYENSISSYESPLSTFGKARV